MPGASSSVYPPVPVGILTMLAWGMRRVGSVVVCLLHRSVLHNRREYGERDCDCCTMLRIERGGGGCASIGCVGSYSTGRIGTKMPSLILRHQVHVQALSRMRIRIISSCLASSPRRLTTIHVLHPLSHHRLKKFSFLPPPLPRSTNSHPY